MLNPGFKFAAILLAAGHSKRFIGHNKLLHDFKGKPLIQHAINEIEKTQFSQMICVLGHEAQTLIQTINHQNFQLVENPNHLSGMGTSIATGAAHLNPDIDAAFICLADMPLIQADHFHQLSYAFIPEQNQKICVPIKDKQTGHPVLFSREFFSELTTLQGDQGARSLLKAHPGTIKTISLSTNAIHYDIDQQKDINQAPETKT